MNDGILIDQFNKWFGYRKIPFSEKISAEVKEQFMTNGGWKGVVDINCTNVKSTSTLTWIMSWVTQQMPEQIGCWEFYHLIFRNDRSENVKERRWCLFEIPKTKSFIKETMILEPFVVASWKQGNKFWSKCEVFGI
ncbi:hypothetical protein [Mycoplasma parvum]|uniref:Uncharacterized protein n=1 Tax=Mycoplasma parvum str. Indiana TaxID=1403316 RepID=U5NFP0_9MOLU|nr:hypothetical protein [Mycoplasma parvum]AGX88979.1 hypothetical protein PRV_01075 [Mycoplasma parvum str. Indiana]